MKLLWAILELMMSGMDAVFLMLIPTFQLGGFRKKIKNWHVVSYITFASVAITAYNFLTSNSVSAIYLGILFVILYVMYCNRGKLAEKIFWTLFPVAIIFVIELVIMKVLLDVFPIEPGQLAKQNGYRLLLFLFGKTLQAAIIMIAYRHRLELKKEKKALILPALLILLSLPAFEMLGREAWSYAIIFLLIGVSCLIYYAIKMNEKHRQEMKIKEMELELKVQQIKKQSVVESMALREYFGKIQGSVNESIQMIWCQAKRDKLMEIDKYLEYFSLINMQFSQLFDTGNPYLDMVLSTKFAFANKKGIQFKTDIESPLKASLDYTDIGNMLTHLIDNAIEALARIHDDRLKKVIEVCLLHCNSGYTVMVANSTGDGSIPPLKAFLANESEGSGLKEVKQIADRYDAVLDTRQEEGYFTTSIRFPKHNYGQEGPC
jgi:hypothetical protein